MHAPSAINPQRLLKLSFCYIIISLEIFLNWSCVFKFHVKQYVWIRFAPKYCNFLSHFFKDSYFNVAFSLLFCALLQKFKTTVKISLNLETIKIHGKSVAYNIILKNHQASKAASLGSVQIMISGYMVEPQYRGGRYFLMEINREKSFKINCLFKN